MHESADTLQQFFVHFKDKIGIMKLLCLSIAYCRFRHYSI
ncbi:hypothetical protein SAMN05518855_1013150 [Paenibacillus sp. CF384]|nr:hypothetical protein SAMN05518855_1013150 [Paenibacillus sp. CF384]